MTRYKRHINPQEDNDAELNEFLRLNLVYATTCAVSQRPLLEVAVVGIQALGPDISAKRIT